MRLPSSWLLAGALLAGCSLTGDPKYFRPLPAATSDGAVSDGAIVDPDAGQPDGVAPDVVDPDVIDPDGGVTPDGGACSPNQNVEQCNGRDDNCNGVIDDVFPAGTVVPCLIADTRPGHLEGCECVPNAPIREVCFNGLDDDADGVVDNGCGCSAVVIPNGTTNGTVLSLVDLLGGTINVYASISRAIAELPAGNRTVCVLNALQSTCVAPSSMLPEATHTEDFVIPADVTVVGGFTVATIASRRQLVANTSAACRTRIIGRATFASDSNERSVLARVALSRTNGGEAVRMDSSGWVVNSLIASVPSAGGDGAAITGDGNGTRVIGSSTVDVNATEDATGVRFTRGRVFVHTLEAMIRSAVPGGVGTALHVSGASLTAVSGLRVSSLRAAGECNGVFIESPLGPTSINGVTGAASVTTKSVGLRLVGEATMPRLVRVHSVSWSGGDATAEAVGLWASGTQVQLVPPGLSQLVGKTGSEQCERAEGLRCDNGARCEIVGSIGARVSLRASAEGAPAATVVHGRGAAVGVNATALLQLVSLHGGAAQRSTEGVEFNGRALSLALSEATTGAAPSAISVNLAGGVQASVQTSVLRADHGIGLQIAADTVNNTRIESNTITRQGANRLSLTELVFLTGGGARSVRFENNLLSCNAGGQVGVRTNDNPTVFSAFAFNLIGGCVVSAAVGAQDLTDAAMIQSRFQAGLTSATGLLRVTSAAGLGADGVHLLSGSDAIDHGSSIARATIDFDGQGRSLDGSPDIGADELVR